mmetsp:Transcript_27417/g.81708  ORF Transcript_27417/g.81708 Transcript_27417/m.81708 type:complete len:182 (-) Transcript_27417:59-604(-)|eukprot:CAMPEP_0175263052 /NCGR_PEP_ID=MMETSP0093-20121207/41590_1 /TAXON_ID=311494 /ORGANISM="Alexandrium monilatum, Strain CCMP3105" /LENGTH=181 /DNA_ID=CAMNT_0016557557 /DNA_START=59 /DNA_END=604 /DNA_ORIENTATION=-
MFGSARRRAAPLCRALAQSSPYLLAAPLGRSAGARAAALRLQRHPFEFFGLRQHRSGAVSPDAELIEFHFKLRDGSRKTVSVPSGTSVLEAAHMNEVDLEGACEASLACSTCHVIVPQDVYDAIPEATEKEEDLLDLAPCLTPTSRLACQVVVNEDLQGVEVELPQMTLNFYVDGHVPTPH